MPKFTRNRAPEATRQRLLDATLALMLRQGFAAVSVDSICAEAQLTKGSFFHHFTSKEAVALAAVDLWAERGTALYSEAWRNPELDPLEQLHLIFDIMIGFNRRQEPCLCMVGMMSQEMALENEVMRKACATHLDAWARMMERLLTEAKRQHPPKVDFEPALVAWFLNSLWQGSMLIGKTRRSPRMVIENLEQARSYVDGLFGRGPTKNSKAKITTNDGRRKS